MFYSRCWQLWASAHLSTSCWILFNLYRYFFRYTCHRSDLSLSRPTVPQLLLQSCLISQTLVAEMCVLSRLWEVYQFCPGLCQLILSRVSQVILVLLGHHEFEFLSTSLFLLRNCPRFQLQLYLGVRRFLSYTFSFSSWSYHFVNASLSTWCPLLPTFMYVTLLVFERLNCPTKQNVI
jgi:hypothetical protein